MQHEARLNIGTELLRTLVAVADLRSYKHAANALRLSQPTISGHMRRLQEQLGADLFDKRVPGVRLTNAGEIAVARARQLLELHDGIIADVGVATAQGSSAALHVGCPTELRCWSLVPVIAELRRTFPGAQIILRSDSSSVLLEQLRNGDLHVCAAISTERESDAQTSSYEQLVWVGSRNPVEIDHGGLPIVAQPVGSLLREVMFDALRDHGVTHHVTLQALHVDGTIAAASLGLGYTVLLQSMVPANGEVSVIDRHSELPVLPGVFWGTFTTPVAIDGRAREMAMFLCDRFAQMSPMKMAASA